MTRVHNNNNNNSKPFFLLSLSPLFEASTSWQTFGPKIHSRWTPAGRPQPSMRMKCVLTAATYVKHLPDQWDHWLGGPFMRPCLTQACHPWERGALLTRMWLLLLLSAALPAASCGLANRLPMRYTQSLGAHCPPSKMPEVFSTALERGFD